MIKTTLECGIYRNGADCSNGGISSRFKNVQIVIEDDFGKEIDFENPPANLVILKKGAFGSVIAEPYGKPPKGHTEYMFGGTYIADSDSRFNRAVEKILGARFYGAIPLHDRTESWEAYEALSH